VIFLHLFDSAKTAVYLPASRFGRKPGVDRVKFGHFQVGENLTLQFVIETPLANQRQQSSGCQSKLHDSASRNRATSAVALSQFATATLNCFAPAVVSE
jgi:hypothetical protein